jgi:hypothetical protein
MRIMSSRQDRLRILDSDEDEQRQFEGYDNFLALITLYGADTLCADARDRVYALLSLLSRKEREMLALTPDYTKSALDIFIHVVRFFRRIEDTYTRDIGSEWSMVEEIEWAIYEIQRMLCLSDNDVGAAFSQDQKTIVDWPSYLVSYGENDLFTRDYSI